MHPAQRHRQGQLGVNGVRLVIVREHAVWEKKHAVVHVLYRGLVKDWTVQRFPVLFEDVQ